VLLAKPELLLGSPALGDVLADRDDAVDRARLVALDRAAPAHAPGLPEAGLHRALEVLSDLASRHAVEVVPTDVRIIVEALEPVMADDLVARPTGQLDQEVVGERDDSSGIDPRCDQGDILERLPVPLFRLAQSLLSRELLGDVAEAPDAADDAPASRCGAESRSIVLPSLSPKTS